MDQEVSGWRITERTVSKTFLGGEAHSIIVTETSSEMLYLVQ